MTYFGMTSYDDPYERRDEWKAEGRNVRNFDIVKRGLTYDEAQELEKEKARTCSRCEKSESHPGGPRKAGNVYSVYSYEYYS